MINESKVKRFCKEDFSLIENYDKAIADTTQTWHCHHRDEVKILPSGIEVRRSVEELKEMDRYYHCPANELIFLTKEEHNRVHFKGKPLSEELKIKIRESNKGKHHSKETKRKISEANKGRHFKLGKAYSDFANKFKEHYGKTHSDDAKLYDREKHWYYKHGKCRWE